MARAPKRENRPAKLRCDDCGNQFVASVPQVGHYVAEISEPALWVIDRIDVSCPKCGSESVGQRDA
jgi:Zn finger protein HypA/HybF involved in hydrogenase expression